MLAGGASSSSRASTGRFANVSASGGGAVNDSAVITEVGKSELCRATLHTPLAGPSCTGLHNITI